MSAPPESAVLSKVTRRLIPFLMLLYFIAFLDRVNIGFAALTMNADLGFSATVFGAGAGIFFVGYVLFEVPSNLALAKFGARRWIARIMFTWGLMSCAMAFIQGTTSFYVVRFLLGAAEAGFFPGIILYLTLWFPAAQRSKFISLFMIAVPLSSVVGAPLSTTIMEMSGLGLKGWQWLFLLEGVPAILLSFAVLFVLADRPETAAWLSDSEKADMARLLAAGRSQTPPDTSLARALTNPLMWLYGATYFGITVGLYGLGFWLPQMVQSFGDLTTREIGLLTAIPYAVAAVVMVLWGRHSDRTRERVWHVAVPAFAGGFGFLVSAVFLSSPLIAFAGLIVAATGVYTTIPTFWTLPTAMVTGAAAAGAIALINSVGNAGGYLGPLIVGYFRDANQSYAVGLSAMSGFIFATGVLVLIANLKSRAASVR